MEVCYGEVAPWPPAAAGWHVCSFLVAFSSMASVFSLVVTRMWWLCVASRKIFCLIGVGTGISK